MRLVRLIVHPRLVGDPVDFPSLATVVGERLLKVGCAGGDVRPAISDQYGPALIWFLVDKLTVSVPELAGRRRKRKYSVLAVGPIQAPLVGLGIE